MARPETREHWWGLCAGFAYRTWPAVPQAILAGMTRWACPACGEDDLAQRKGGALYCIDCLAARNWYRTTRSNIRSGFNRTNKGSPGLDITADDFCRWRKQQEQKCHYCGIAESDLPRVRMKSQIQRGVKVMGVDRVDSDLGYQLDNLVPCCFVCNQIKGDRFTVAEMVTVGTAVGAVWERRLDALKEILDEEEPEYQS